MQILHETLSALNFVAVHTPWNAVAASGILSGLLVGPQRLLKKWLTNHEPLMIALVGLSGLAVVAFHYLMSNPTFSPALVPVYGLAVAFGTQPFYFIVVKPFLAWFGRQVEQAAATQAAAATAAVPAGGLPNPTAATLVAPGVPQNIPIQSF